MTVIKVSVLGQKGQKRDAARFAVFPGGLSDEGKESLREILGLVKAGYIYRGQRLDTQSILRRTLVISRILGGPKGELLDTPENPFDLEILEVVF